jgi:hypothetical protein
MIFPHSADPALQKRPGMDKVAFGYFLFAVGFGEFQQCLDVMP